LKLGKLFLIGDICYCVSYASFKSQFINEIYKTFCIFQNNKTLTLKYMQPYGGFIYDFNYT